MPVTIRDADTDRVLAEEAKRRGGISKHATALSLIAERLEDLRREREAKDQKTKRAPRQPAGA